jgi:hypothetical protein
MIYTTASIILWAKISQALCSRDEHKKQATSIRSVDIEHHIKLYVERKSLEWYNDQTNDADDLFKIQNWVWALTFPYGLKAQFISGGSGGQVVPITPSSDNLLIPYDFIVSGVTSTGAPLKAGDTVVILDGTNGTQNFRGCNVEFYRGGQPNYTTNPLDGTVYYSWNPATGRFAISAEAQLGEQFRIIPTVGITGTASTPDHTTVTYNLTAATAIPNPTASTNYLTVIITPNGNTYTWGNEYIFSDNYPEQPGAIAASTIQIYTFQKVSSRWLCIDQSLNIPS